MTENSTSKLYKFGLAIWNGKLWLQKCLMVGTCIAFTSFVMIQIVFRYFLFLPLHGIEELAVHLAVWTYFIGGAYGAYEKSHISANLLPTFIKSKRINAIIAIIVSAITAFIAICMAFWAAKYLLWSIDRQPASLELRIPLYWVHASMFVGLGLMSFYFFIGFIEDILKLTSGRYKNEQEFMKEDI